MNAKPATITLTEEWTFRITTPMGALFKGGSLVTINVGGNAVDLTVPELRELLDEVNKKLPLRPGPYGE